VLEVWLDGFVLLVEVGEIRDDILDNVGVRERVDLGLLFCVDGNTAQTSQCVATINIHCTASTNSLSATPSERKSRIDLILDSNQRIQHHGSGLV